MKPDKFDKANMKPNMTGGKPTNTQQQGARTQTQTTQPGARPQAGGWQQPGQQQGRPNQQHNKGTNTGRTDTGKGKF